MVKYNYLSKEGIEMFDVRDKAGVAPRWEERFLEKANLRIKSDSILAKHQIWKRSKFKRHHSFLVDVWEIPCCQQLPPTTVKTEIFLYVFFCDLPPAPTNIGSDIRNCIIFIWFVLLIKAGKEFIFQPVEVNTHTYFHRITRVTISYSDYRFCRQLS